MTSTVALATVLVLGVQTAPFAQEVLAQDFRSRPSYTPDELANVLFPQTAPQVRTRGIGPAQSRTSLPVRPAITLNVHFASNSDTVPPSAHQDLDKPGTILAWPQYNEYRIVFAVNTVSLGAD